MAEAALSFAVEKLGDLLIQKAVFLKGVKGQVTWLKDELKMMQCFLKDAAEKQAADERIRKWVSDIRDVAQDAEDAIETFIMKADYPRRSRGLLGRCTSFPIHMYHLNKVGEEIESIRTRLQDIEKRQQKYGIQNLGVGISHSSRRSVEWRRSLSPWQIDKDVVGLEEDVKLLLQRAILYEKENKGLSIATIEGMGGIGKSTLARKVYNHRDVVDRFERRAWVVVSMEFVPEKIIKELILQLLQPEEDKLNVMNVTEKSPLTHLQKMLYERLLGKRYFVVLDDVWQEDAWESIAGAFPNEDKGSRLMLTSRNQIVTKQTKYAHKMKTLDPDKSWKLFLKKALIDNSDGKCPEELESTGREILKKCDGLPLAITVAGGLLVKQRPSKTEWEKVLKQLMNHHFGSSSTVSAVLELSYYDLPPQLKSCFLCLGFFKEDATIKAEKLIQFWIAQGLVPQEGRDETMEEIARSYLDELINRNMVQVKHLRKDYQVKHCQVHDLLRELSIAKAKEEINFEILSEEGNSRSSEKPRHLAIYCSTERLLPNKHIRSLFLCGAGGRVDGSPSYWKRFGLLRILDFENFELTSSLPVAIGTLISLRYLGLRHTGIKELPSAVGCLRNLETLDFGMNGRVKVPNVMWKLVNLRHLYMSAEIECDEPLRLDTLKNLQTLVDITVEKWMFEQAEQLTKLVKLVIRMEANSDAARKIFASLSKLQNLASLTIREPPLPPPSPSINVGGGGGPPSPTMQALASIESLTQLKIDGRLCTLPHDFPPNITHLSLINTLLKEDLMPLLHKLSKLVCLKLNFAYAASDDQDEFPVRQALSLAELLDSRGMRIEVQGSDSDYFLQTWRYINRRRLLRHIKNVANPR